MVYVLHLFVISLHIRSKQAITFQLIPKQYGVPRNLACSWWDSLTSYHFIFLFCKYSEILTMATGSINALIYLLWVDWVCNMLSCFVSCICVKGSSNPWNDTNVSSNVSHGNPLQKRVNPAILKFAFSFFSDFSKICSYTVFEMVMIINHFSQCPHEHNGCIEKLL